MLEVQIYTRSEIRAYRQKWIDFLMAKGRKKATGQLDAGGGARCCLGHGCYILGIKAESFGEGGWEYDGSEGLAPASFIEMVGLWNDTGSTNFSTPIKIFKKESAHDNVDLAGINDDTNASPLRIGRYLLSVIEGGDDTPFKPLTDYPE